MKIAPVLFWLLAGGIGVSALMVVVTQNIVRAAAWLLFTLAGVSALYFLLAADFVGATQLIVYVGGTLVLVVFGVMLTAQGPFVSMKTGAAEWGISTVVGLLLYGVLSIALLTKPMKFSGEESTQGEEMTRTTVLGGRASTTRRLSRCTSGGSSRTPSRTRPRTAWTGRATCSRSPSWATTRRW